MTIGANALSRGSEGQSLKFAERDASRFDGALATQTAFEQVDRVLLVDTVHKPDVLEALARVLNASAPDDQVVVFFAGHGIVETTSQGPELFLGVHGTDLETIEETAISATELFAPLENCRARSCTALLDCCFGGAARTRSLLGPRYLADLRAGRKMVRKSPPIEGEGRLVIGAARADREAYESATLKAGFFTHHLLEILYRHRRDAVLPVSSVFGELVLDLNRSTEGRQLPYFSGDDGGAMLPTVQATARDV